MKPKSIRYLICADSYRYGGKRGVLSLVGNALKYPGVSFSIYLRASHGLGRNPLGKITLYPFARLLLNHCRIKYHIDIPHVTDIGPGLYIGHLGDVVVNGAARIGKNCNLSPGVVIGAANRGSRKGVPVIGDNVYIAPGAKIIGNITVGNNVAIGANAVVLDDLPDNAVAAGNPAKVMSLNGVEGYIEFTDYDSSD